MLSPLFFQPIFKSAIWGGSRLKPLLGDAGIADATGEAWLLSDQGPNQSIVSHGEFAGRTLRSLLEEHGEAILGRSSLSAGRFPVLLKLLDARQALSVQVHPTDALAKAMPAPAGVENPGLGKTEAWYILSAESQSRIYAGINSGTSLEQIRCGLAAGDVSGWLYSSKPKPGDCYFLEAGTVHAIGENILLFEIQQTSDITYRMFDWNRVDQKTGKPRELHVEASLQCTNLALGPVNPQSPRSVLEQGGQQELLATCPYFDLWKWEMETPFSVGTPGEARVFVVTAGAGKVVAPGFTRNIRFGATALIPACVGPVWIEPTEPMTVLECGLPVHT